MTALRRGPGFGVYFCVLNNTRNCTDKCDRLENIRRKVSTSWTSCDRMECGTEKLFWVLFWALSWSVFLKDEALSIAYNGHETPQHHGALIARCCLQRGQRLRHLIGDEQLDGQPGDFVYGRGPFFV